MSLSELEPLPIDVLRLPNTEGLVGISYCPGRWQPGFSLFRSQRHLGQDLATIRQWGALTVVTLLQESEFKRLGVPSLGEAIRAEGLQWFHAPIRDFSAPSSAFELAWSEAGPVVRQQLRKGQRVFIHCRAGLGRSGTLAARLRVEFGDSPDTAMAAVRQARPGTVENAEQRDYILNLDDHQGIAWNETGPDNGL
ncbi:dual specificity protein phosphatase-like protein [Halospina denitrificans]|uniref:Dual specificity protein phosphatase-like protein n=1 Tax=Halospina denitrificans TaxID=332522 RepID=A0A4R7JTI7_9GAMM|nr:cyclin-dependent kinase inhibitor 3 family protein [Halospina denitrificans]TDT40199.1 dual specificity protein phosphatase-like protein [Halospina denitrificans]